MAHSVKVIGADERARTVDLLITNCQRITTQRVPNSRNSLYFQSHNSAPWIALSRCYLGSPTYFHAITLG